MWKKWVPSGGVHSVHGVKPLTKKMGPRFISTITAESEGPKNELRSSRKEKKGKESRQYLQPPPRFRVYDVSRTNIDSKTQTILDPFHSTLATDRSSTNTIDESFNGICSDPIKASSSTNDKTVKILYVNEKMKQINQKQKSRKHLSERGSEYFGDSNWSPRRINGNNNGDGDNEFFDNVDWWSMSENITHESSASHVSTAPSSATEPSSLHLSGNSSTSSLEWDGYMVFPDRFDLSESATNRIGKPIASLELSDTSVSLMQSTPLFTQTPIDFPDTIKSLESSVPLLLPHASGRTYDPQYSSASTDEKVVHTDDSTNVFNKQSYTIKGLQQGLSYGYEVGELPASENDLELELCIRDSYEELSKELLDAERTKADISDGSSIGTTSQCTLDRCGLSITHLEKNKREYYQTSFVELNFSKDDQHTVDRCSFSGTKTLLTSTKIVNTETASSQYFQKCFVKPNISKDVKFNSDRYSFPDTDAQLSFKNILRKERNTECEQACFPELKFSAKHSTFDRCSIASTKAPLPPIKIAKTESDYRHSYQKCFMELKNSKDDLYTPNRFVCVSNGAPLPLRRILKTEKESLRRYQSCFQKVDLSRTRPPTFNSQTTAPVSTQCTFDSCILPSTTTATRKSSSRECSKKSEQSCSAIAPFSKDNQCCDFLDTVDPLMSEKSANTETYHKRCSSEVEFSKDDQRSSHGYSFLGTQAPLPDTEDSMHFKKFSQKDNDSKQSSLELDLSKDNQSTCETYNCQDTLDALRSKESSQEEKDSKTGTDTCFPELEFSQNNQCTDNRYRFLDTLAPMTPKISTQTENDSSQCSETSSPDLEFSKDNQSTSEICYCQDTQDALRSKESAQEEKDSKSGSETCFPELEFSKNNQCTDNRYRFPGTLRPMRPKKSNSERPWL